MRLYQACAAAAGIAGLSTASAMAVEPHSVGYTLNPGGPGFTSGSSAGSYSASAGGGSASVSVALSPVPYIIAHAHSTELTSNPDGYYEPSASALFEYGYSASFSCDGGSPCAQTPFAPLHPITVSGYVNSQVEGTGSFVSIQLGNVDGGVSLYCTANSADCGVHAYSFGRALTGTITPGSNGSYTVDYVDHLTFGVEALANTRPDAGDPAGDAWAYIDPIISFDAAELAAGGFTAGTITLSPGIANASAPPPAFGGAVPEPGTWALMIAGFGLTGSMLRRRTPARAA